MEGPCLTERLRSGACVLRACAESAPSAPYASISSSAYLPRPRNTIAYAGVLFRVRAALAEAWSFQPPTMTDCEDPESSCVHRSTLSVRYRVLRCCVAYSPLSVGTSVGFVYSCLPVAYLTRTRTRTRTFMCSCLPAAYLCTRPRDNSALEMATVPQGSHTAASSGTDGANFAARGPTCRRFSSTGRAGTRVVPTVHLRQKCQAPPHTSTLHTRGHRHIRSAFPSLPFPCHSGLSRMSPEPSTAVP